MAKLLNRLALDVAPIVMLAGAAVATLRGANPAGVAGRGARSPAEIPARGWKEILQRTGKEFSADQIPLIAGGVTFYTLLALFPGLGAFVALYGLFADVAQVQDHLAALAGFLPRDALAFVADQAMRIAGQNDGGLSLAFAIGLVISIWSANGAVKAFITGLNIAYEAEEKRNIVRQTGVSLAFTAGFLVFVIAAMAVMAAGPALAAFVGPQAGVAFNLAAWPVLLLAMGLGLALLYRFGPCRPKAPWRWITWGSAAAVVLWLAVSAAFSVYVGNFAHYDKTYGPLGAAVGFMTWIWLSSMVVLAGAELNSEVERQAQPADAPGVGGLRAALLRALGGQPAIR
ncbi:MAG: YihY/virulence factor BrkB family protein [Phenylobacterium sp.]